MVKVAYPFATTPIVDDVSWRRMARLWARTGIVRPGDVSGAAFAPALLVYGDATGYNVKVSPGEAIVDGGYFSQDATITLPINGPGANPRIDTIALRWDGPLNTADYVVLQGTAAVTPVAPTLTQVQGGRWEEALADVRVNVGVANIAASAVTDRRRFAAALGVSGGQNLLVNPDFEFWQRGNGPFTGGTLTADKWRMLSGGGTMSVAKDVSNQDVGSPACLALTTTGLGAGQNQFIFQIIEDFVKLRGKTVALSLRIKSTANCYIELLDDTGATGVNVPGNGQWQTAYVTKTIAATATVVQVRLEVLGNGVSYLNKAMLVVGSTPVDYAPRAAGDDLALCQRYYETGTVRWSWYGQPVTLACFAVYTTLRFQVPKAVTPTLTLSGIARTWVTQDNHNPAMPAGTSQATPNLDQFGFMRQLDWCAEWNQAAVGNEIFTWVADTGL